MANKKSVTGRETEAPGTAVQQGTAINGFDIDDPQLPGFVTDVAMESGGFPYSRRVKKKHYEAELRPLQLELLKLQSHVKKKRRAPRCRLRGQGHSGKRRLHQALHGAP